MLETEPNHCLNLLIRRIQNEGPIRVHTFMQECLNGEFGYYRQANDPLGISGDFITSPEISQIFGEMIGLWCVDQWRKLGKPESFALCELGPGRGTLMADALRAMAHIISVKQAVNLYLLEINPVLRQKQAEKLTGFTPHWIDNLAQLPELPTIFIANEFWDALPVDQIIFTQSAWHLREVGYNGAHLLFTVGKALDEKTAKQIAWPQNPPQDGNILEFNFAGQEFMRQIASHIRKNSGAAVIIDYGHLQTGYGDTIQSLRHHQKVDPLAYPGQSDLTCHVDFSVLRQIAAGLNLHIGYFTTQQDFLKTMGSDLRLQQLLLKANAKQSVDLTAGIERLTSPEQMGSLFKVLSIHSMSP